MIRTVGAACVVALLVAVAPGVALAAPGELDGSYATGGVFTSAFQTPQSPGQLAFAAVDSQQRTVIAATHVDAQGQSHLDVLRLTPQGTVDTSFGSGGVVEVDFSASLSGLNVDVVARGVAIAAGDKVVALGWVNDPVHSIETTALVRLGSDGSYDPAFGSNGRAVANSTEFPASLAVDPFGRILVGGSCGNSCGGFVARYTATGTLDTGGFNLTDPVHPGVQVITQASDVPSLAALGDGSVLAAGGTSPTDDAVIARITPNGLLDPSFGSGGAPGVVTSGMGRSNPQTSVAVAHGVAAGPGGSVYVAGEVSDNGVTARLLRLTQRGSPDAGFGAGSPATGVVSLPVTSANAVAVTVDSSSCPVLTGTATVVVNGATSSRILAARLDSTGRVDTAFNPSGPTPGTALLSAGDSAFGQTIALQSDGNIVIGGNRQQGTNPIDRRAVTLRLQGGGCSSPPPPHPTAVTGQATNVSSDAATLNGTVNPNGSQVTDCHFEYGTTTNYGSSVPCSQSPGSGNSPVAVSAPISGLSPGTTYDYRLVATGSGSTSDGNNLTFTTTLPPTTVPTFQHWGSTSGVSITVPGGATGEYDSAEVNGTNASPQSGTVNFRLYSSSACTTASLVFSSPKSVAQIAAGTAFASSDPVAQQLSPGTYYWTAAYSGDAFNQPSTSPCGAETLTVQPPQPTTVPTFQHGGSTSGVSITVPGGATGEYDSAEVIGTNAAPQSGTVIFRLYSNPACTAARLVFSSTQSVGQIAAGTGFASSDPVMQQLAPGTYYWTVSYSGDAANQPSASPCGAETLTVQPARILSHGGVLSPQGVTLPIRCSLLPCTLRLTITFPALLKASDARQQAKNKARVTTLARGRVTIKEHGAQTVRLPLTAAGRKFFTSHKGQVTVTAAVAMTIHGHASTAKQHLKLKITKTRTR